MTSSDTPKQTLRSDDPIDELLRHWDERLPCPDAEQLDGLRLRILSGLTEHEQHEPAAPGTLAGAQVARPWRRTLIGTVVVAALLLVAVSIWTFQTQTRRQSPGQPKKLADDRQLPTPAFAQMENQILMHKAELLLEMEQLFENRVLWVAETDGSVRMGLHDGDNDAFQQPLAIRVVLARRGGDGNGWRRLWTVDVIARSERVVRISTTAGDGVELSLWAYVLPDGMIAVDSNVATEGTIRLRATASHVQRPNQPTEILSRSDDESEYRLFQTVALLDEA